MGVEFLAGGVAVMGIALITGCHDAWRGLRLRRVVGSLHRRQE